MTQTDGRIPDMKITMIFDIVCPYCYLGKIQLQRAISRMPDIEVAIDFTHYQLEPDVPESGYDYWPTIEAKFGGKERVHQQFAKIEELGKNLGVDLKFSRITKGANTLHAHRLIKWAGAYGCQGMVADAVFSAYFQEGKDIGDKNILLDIAASHKMERDEIGSRLASEQDRRWVTEQSAIAGHQLTNGVPLFRFESGFTLSGVRPESELLTRFEKELANPADKIA